ncbi:MAG: hypothetical protein J1E83_03280 [Lachnospiraceae bacterium]|nr:hypothetical protein [Lachnospiraceae bacterium]
MKKTVKILGIIILAIVVALIAIVILPFIKASVIDNMALNKYRSRILNELELPTDTEIVETVSGCGNTGGTGNHTELLVSVLVKSELDEDAFFAYYPHAYEAEERDFETWAMGCVGLSFNKPEEEGNYYILEYIKSAPCSDFDLRGH